jgi:hypothetical protein
MESRLVSIEEGNRMLPLLRRIVKDITKKWELIIYKRTELECLEKGFDSTHGELSEEERESRIEGLKQDLNYLIDKINSYIREVEDLGCFVEEFKRGIINFPSLYNGRKVFLCWTPDEDTVTHWHELDESYNDRVRIKDFSDFLCQKPHVG